ncbi:hypothetical protein GCM10010455_11400 [Microbacterium esteraromaticum]
MTDNNAPGPPPSSWDRARAAHWHGSSPSAETSARDIKAQADKAQADKTKAGSEVEDADGVVINE